MLVRFFYQMVERINKPYTEVTPRKVRFTRALEQLRVSGFHAPPSALSATCHSASETWTFESLYRITDRVLGVPTGLSKLKQT